jgi:hypothetical protein
MFEYSGRPSNANEYSSTGSATAGYFRQEHGRNS